MKAKTIHSLSLFQILLILEYGPSNVPLETRWDWFPPYDLLNHRVKRIYLLWQAKQKF